MSNKLIGLICLVSLTCQIGSTQSFNQVNTLKNKYIKTKEKISKSELFTRRVSKTLYTVNRQTRRIRRQRNKLRTEMQVVKIKVNDLNEKISNLEKSVAGRKTQIAKQIKALYKLSNFNKFMYILNSSSVHEFEQNLKYIKLYSESDYDLILSYSSDIEELKKMKLDLDKNISRLNSVAKTLKTKNYKLNKKIKSKKTLLAHLRKQRVTYFNKLSKMKNIKEKLILSDKIDNLNEIFGTDFFEKRGSLGKPVEGFKIENYGVLVDEKYKNKIKSNGVFFRSNKSRHTYNVHKGKVSFVGKMRGLGTVVVIDHSNHYYSLYGNNKTVYVKEGDKLNVGHKLGRVGYSPYHRTYGTYFEVRHFAEPLNPDNWLSKTSISQKKM